jgi:hypothetical protein
VNTIITITANTTTPSTHATTFSPNLFTGRG